MQATPTHSSQVPWLKCNRRRPPAPGETPERKIGQQRAPRSPAGCGPARDGPLTIICSRGRLHTGWVLLTIHSFPFADCLFIVLRGPDRQLEGLGEYTGLLCICSVCPLHPLAPLGLSADGAAWTSGVMRRLAPGSASIAAGRECRPLAAEACRHHSRRHSHPSADSPGGGLPYLHHDDAYAVAAGPVTGSRMGCLRGPAHRLVPGRGSKRL